MDAVTESAVPDVLAPGLRVVFCGINPGRASAAAGAHFANPRNDFWRLLHAAGFSPRELEPAEQWEALAEGVGLTNAAFRTTPGSGDLRRGDFTGAAERLEALAADLHPGWIAFVGKEAYRGAFGERAELGPQERKLSHTRLFVLPSTSPANAAVPWAERLRWFRELALLSEPLVRPGVRALLIDQDRVFLHRFTAPRNPGIWIAPGGGVDEGETDEDALVRELREELSLDQAVVGPWVWYRRHVWAWRGTILDSRERFALATVDPARIVPTGLDSVFVGSDYVEEHRWWAVDEIAQSDDVFAPRRFAEELRRLVEHGPPREPIDVGI
jgi:double-stranded uracil-DNA glycosylase